VEFYLPNAGNVMLDLYDASGRRVERIVQGRFPAGKHQVPIKTGLTLGVYFVKGRIEDEVASGKFVVTY
jgi:hypothetical protein